ncbi:site-specific DNA-methyltransferase [Spirosoma sp. 209]|uniref:site-specific DNA-methyltransferase n=1 Tax=Spirosoma sp. 209 TaxID=1955701 RepID=UPI00111747AE|nr:site-specific DNA-methyltransferase [Spirosoma sp. 209]
MLQIVSYPSEKREQLFDKYADKLEKTQKFSRKTVSFQANKQEPIYRWFKYKEGFASTLVKNILSEYHPGPGRVLDPFAGAGTTLFAGRNLGWNTTGIELLPVGAFVMSVRQALENLDLEAFKRRVATFWEDVLETRTNRTYIQHIAITKDAFPPETDDLLNKYLAYCESIPDEHLSKMFQFAAFTILEEISYTRKDGQYLRWDARSPRDLKGSFDKGKIFTFEESIKRKLNHILSDLEQDEFLPLFHQEAVGPTADGAIQVLQGSCLDLLPTLESGQFDFVVTSPPYCNRYDYTRTYALELVFLGYNHEQVRDLRQTMLSCTVENKEKVEYLRALYETHGQSEAFERVISTYYNTEAMTEVNSVLDELNTLGKLNNPGIARMVKNYFLEMCFVIYEMSRTLRPGGYVAMVNDNVRYGGEEIPVDLILSEFASHFDMEVERIFVLEQSKGNSSQQMGAHGRTEIRKCVYLWRKQQDNN